MTSKTTKSLVDKKYRLEKFPGKGGWTFAQIPEIAMDKNNPFGWVKVRGSIDGYEISKYHLMPMGNGRLFLPVKADIRRKIGKQEGDLVHVILFRDNEPLEVPQELIECLEQDTQALTFFNGLTESEKKHYIDWIYTARKEQTRVKRIAEAMNRLARSLKRYDANPSPARKKR